MKFSALAITGFRRWFQALADRWTRRRRLSIIRTDEMPERTSSRHLYVIGERGEDWYAAMVCPCGCGALIDLNLQPPGRPRWRLTTEPDGSPSLAPSIWRQVDCRAHFFVRRGRIVWTRNERT